MKRSIKVRNRSDANCHFSNDDEWLEYAVTDVPKLFANQPRSIAETQPRSKLRIGRPRLVLLKRELFDPGA